MLQPTREMLAGMDAELISGLAAMKHTADDMAARRNDDEAANKKGNTKAAARRNDDEAADNENDTTGAAKKDDDEMRKNKRNNMTTEEDDNMTTAGCHQRTMEMSAEERWGFPFEMGKEIPRSKMIARVERNTETGTQTKVTREEEDSKRAAEDLWKNPWRCETN